MRKGLFEKLAPAPLGLPFLAKMKCMAIVIALFAYTQASATTASPRSEISAQNSKTITLTGAVKDASGFLPGVTVIVAGTTNGTVTDANGKYRLTGVSPDASITFSFIGMKTETIAVGGKSELNLTMSSDNISLDEVVAIGYGTQKQKNVTGAIANVQLEQIENLPVSNLSESLRGQIPGLSIEGGSQRPGEASTMQVRQTFSFSKDGGSDVPLVVIDDMVQVDPQSGLPSLDAFNRLDPSEIESITVLRDGSAAIYGSRASQGAVVVRTKRGQAGKTRITYSGQFSVNDAISHSKTMSAYDYGVWMNRFLTADNRAGNENANLFSESELEKMKSLNYDWLDEAWSPATQQRHAVTLSGGNEKATYFAGATYFTQGANLGDQDFNKWNFRTGVDAKIAKDLKLSASVSGNSGYIQKSFTKATANINDSSYGSKAGGGEQADYGYLLHMPKYIPWSTTIDGEDYFVSPFPRTDRNLGSANSNRTIAGWNYFATKDNGSKQTSEDFSFNANFSLTYEVPFVKGLSARASFSRTQSASNNEQVQLPYMLARITNYNSEGNHLENENSKWKIEENQRNSRVYYDNVNSKSTQSNFFLNYARVFGDHDLSAMAGVERSEAYYTRRRLSYEDTKSDYGGTSGTAGELSDNSVAAKSESGTLSYLGRVNYAYKSKYLAQFMFRSDASTKFAPENYWGFFPSASFGWVMSEEDWFKEALPVVDFLKLRYSIGKTGKDNVKAWRWLQLYDVYTDKGFEFGPDGGSLGGGVSPKVSPNRNVGWDSTIKHNLGIDLAFLNNRLRFGYDYYFDRTEDALTVMSTSVGVPISVGGGFAEENYASIDAWGHEFNLNWSDRVGSDFNYSVGFIFGFNNNKIKKYPQGALQHPSNNVTTVGSSTIFPYWGFETWKETSTGDGILRTDEDIDKYWAYLEANATAAGTEANYMDIKEADGMQKGMLAYRDAGGAFNSTDGTQAGPDGRIEKNNDYVKLVKRNKTHGFTTNLRAKYKSISFSTQLNTSWGGYRELDVVKQGTSSSHNMWAHESYWSDMYAADNLDGKYPSLNKYDEVAAPSDFWQLNTFRCFVRNISIAYDLPRNLVSKVNIEKASIGVTGNNLWDFYNPYPEKYRNMYDNSYVSYPTLRTWAINLNVTF